MDVRLPDGRVVKNVPEGTTKQALTEKLVRGGAISQDQAAELMPTPERTEVPIRVGPFEVSEDNPVGQAVVGLGSGLVRAGQGIGQLALEAGEAVGLVDEGRADEFTQQAQTEQRAFQQTPVGQSVAGRAGQFAGEILPLTAAGAGGAALAARAAPGAAAALTGAGRAPAAARGVANLAGGAAGGSAAFVPEGESRATNAAIGGAAGAVLGPVAGAIGRRLSAATSRATAPLTRGRRFNAARQAIRDSDAIKQGVIEASDVDRIAGDVADGLTPEQAIRKFQIESVGGVPTRGRISGRTEDRQFEFQQMRGDNALSQAQQQSREAFFEGQERRVGALASDADRGVAGDAAQEALERGRTAARDQERRLFDAAGERLAEMGDDIQVRPNAMGEVLQEEVDFLEEVRPVFNRLRRAGVVDAEGALVEGASLTPKRAEALRRGLGKIARDGSPNEKRVARRVQNALQDDVRRDVGEDVFEEARRFSATERFTKFDNQRKISDLLNGKIDPQQVVPSLSRPAFRTNEVKQFFNTLDEVAPEAANQVRGSVLADIFESSRSSATDAQGVADVTVASFKKRLDRIGNNKLNAIFGDGAAKELRNMANASDVLFGVTRREIDPGTADTVIKKLGQSFGNLLDMVPGGRFIGGLFRAVKTGAQNRETERKIRRALNIELMKREQMLEDALSPSPQFGASAGIGSAAPQSEAAQSTADNILHLPEIVVSP